MRQTTYAVMLSEEDRAHLRTLIVQGTASVRLLTPARILLKADQGEGGPAWSDAAIAGVVDVHPATVGRVRRTSGEHGLSASLPNAPWLELLQDPPALEAGEFQGLLAEPLVPDADGYVRVPEGPGLGAELSEVATGVG